MLTVMRLPVVIAWLWSLSLLNGPVLAEQLRLTVAHNAGRGEACRRVDVVPPAIAMELALTGDTLDAARAHHFGLINDLCESGQALTAARALAGRVVANAPLAVRASRRLILDAPSQSDRAGMRAAGEAMAELSSTADFAEGPLAFIEKRPPRWTGS